MAVNPTVLLTFFLLILMMGAGLASGTWGYSLGRQALRGITQPDGSPSKQLGRAEPISDASGEERMIFVNEADVIDRVKARMSGKEEPQAAAPAPSPVSAVSNSSAEATAAVDSSNGSSAVAAEATPVVDTSEVAVEESSAIAGDDALAADEEMPIASEGEPQADPFAEPEPFLDTAPDQAASP